MSGRVVITEGVHRVEVGTGERAEVVVVIAEGDAPAVDLTVDLVAPRAEVDVYALWLASASQKIELSIRVNHLAPDCRSNQSIKGVASGDGEGVFRGKVYVAEGAQRTNALQQSRNILLSDASRAHVEPQLEIYADDVKCSHGATVGQMDEGAVLYMRQRGLSDADARRLLLRGFIADILDRMPQDQAEEIFKRIEGR